MIKVIIFDWGNVIVSYDNIRQTNKMSAHFKVDKKLFEKIELRNRLKHDLGELSTSEFVRNISNGLDRKISVTGYYSLMDKFKVAKLNAGLVGLIKKLRKKYIIFLLSNNSPPVKAEIKRYALEKLFDKALFSYQVGIKKPNPKFFKMIIAKTNFSYENCLFIDDREDICKVAGKLGMKTIVFKNNVQLKKKLEAFSINIK